MGLAGWNQVNDVSIPRVERHTLQCWDGVSLQTQADGDWLAGQKRQGNRD